MSELLEMDGLMEEEEEEETDGRAWLIDGWMER